MTNKKLERRNRFVYDCTISLEQGIKVPRKVKKYILGPKQSKNKLRKKIKTVDILNHVRSNGYVEPYPSEEFCPHCGCKASYSGENQVSYPCVWETLYCLRCNKIVASADNSCMIHALVWLKSVDKRG